MTESRGYKYFAPWLVTQLLGFASIALGFAHFYLILRVVLNRDPFDFDYVPPEGEDEFRVDISKRKKEKNQPA